MRSVSGVDERNTDQGSEFAHAPVTRVQRHGRIDRDASSDDSGVNPADPSAIHAEALDQGVEVCAPQRFHACESEDDVAQTGCLLAASHGHFAGDIRVPERRSFGDRPIDRRIAVPDMPDPCARIKENAGRDWPGSCARIQTRFARHSTGSSGLRRGGTSKFGSMPRILAA